LSNANQLVTAFRKRDIESSLSESHTFEKELQGKCRLAGAGLTVDEIKMVFRETTPANIVKSVKPRA